MLALHSWISESLTYMPTYALRLRLLPSGQLEIKRPGRGMPVEGHISPTSTLIFT